MLFKDVDDVRSVQSALLPSLEYEVKSLRRQYTIQTTSLESARAVSVQFQVSIDYFTEAMRAVMDASVSELKQFIV